VPYKETIRKGTTQHSRYKKQSGGHGQFGDVVIDISPLPTGTGFTFDNKITGGAIPRQYIPSVENGIKEYLAKGPLGFPVVDVGVVLTDGSFHAVDSSDMAFKTAGRLAMTEAMPNCAPVLLEPIMLVKFMVPSEFTPKINSLISGRRGQILGFDAREGWKGWDTVEAHMPQSEIHDIINELRSMTLGSGTFVAEFDHVTELTGRLADQVLSAEAAE
jgi:elongation factor G